MAVGNVVWGPIIYYVYYATFGNKNLEQQTFAVNGPQPPVKSRNESTRYSTISTISVLEIK